MARRKDLRPSELYTARMREVREDRGWTQRDFVEVLGYLGAKVDRATVARIENRDRGLSLDEAILFAAALRTSLENMIIPSDLLARAGAPQTIQIAPKLRPPARDVRNWLKGMQALRPEDRGAWLKAMPDNDLQAATDFDVFALASMVQNLIDAVGADDLDAARERVGAIRPVLDEIERKIDREES